MDVQAAEGRVKQVWPGVGMLPDAQPGMAHVTGAALFHSVPAQSANGHGFDQGLAKLRRQEFIMSAGLLTTTRQIGRDGQAWPGQRIHQTAGGPGCPAPGTRIDRGHALSGSLQLPGKQGAREALTHDQVSMANAVGRTVDCTATGSTKSLTVPERRTAG